MSGKLRRECTGAAATLRVAPLPAAAPPCRVALSASLEAAHGYSFPSQAARPLPLLPPTSPGLPDPWPGRCLPSCPRSFFTAPCPALPASVPSGTSRPAGSRASVGLSLRTSRRPWHPLITVSRLVWPRCFALAPLSPLSLEPSAPISGGLVSELSRSLLPGRALRWVPSVSSARPSRGPLPPASFPSPASLGLGLGGGGGGAGRGGRAGRGGAVTRGQPG